jgi:hypothetical protein
MIRRVKHILPLLLAVLFGVSARCQQAFPDRPQSPAGAALPTPEEFVNAILPQFVDSSFEHYYLVIGTDSCRFLKYDYDEWIKYHLKEPLPVNILNDLSEKVYLSRFPFFWRQPRLQKAICITRKQADSILAGNPAFAHEPADPQKKGGFHLDWRRYVYSLSLPQFTDDGQYAVIDINFICGPVCGQGITAIFRLTTSGDWKLAGQVTNWTSR